MTCSVLSVLPASHKSPFRPPPPSLLASPHGTHSRSTSPGRAASPAWPKISGNISARSMSRPNPSAARPRPSSRSPTTPSAPSCVTPQASSSTPYRHHAPPSDASPAYKDLLVLLHHLAGRLAQAIIVHECSPPFGIWYVITHACMDERYDFRVLTAFRHLVCNHAVAADGLQVLRVVLTAFRHLVCNHARAAATLPGYQVCSPPFGIWYVITRRGGHHRPPHLRAHRLSASGM